MVFTRMVVVLSAVLVSAVAQLPAAQAAPVEDVVAESVAHPGQAWQAPARSGRAVTAQRLDRQDRQLWSHHHGGPIVNAGTGLCATAAGNGVVALPCQDDDAQQWHGISRDPMVIRNRATGTCVAHGGSAQRLVLAPCDTDRPDQQWHVHP